MHLSHCQIHMHLINEYKNTFEINIFINDYAESETTPFYFLKSNFGKIFIHFISEIISQLLFSNQIVQFRKGISPY